MNRPEVPGSKPRKFITRTILTNPSLISVSVTSLFDPENHSLPKIYSALEKKQQMAAEHETRIFNDPPTRLERQSSLQERSSSLYRHPSTRLDSLQEAEREFLSKKAVQPEKAERSPLLMKKELSKELSFMSRGSSTPALLPSTFNYKNSGEIKHKQTVGYNIISNLA